MNLTSEAWIGRASMAKSFFSAKGMVLKKMIVSMENEAGFYVSYIQDPLPGFEPHMEDKDMAPTLLGVEIMFTSKLPEERILYLAENE